ncbi:MAG: glycosyltransferase family 2 protein [Planctomycetaceae bacterium]|nr:glycosyltransferase family 2 protein [Planctomycetaceae bacterium]
MDKIIFANSAVAGRVSIIIPTRRAERFIGDTLATIGMQTYPNWEVIVVEDGSQGATEQIVSSFAKRHPTNRVEYSRNDRSYGASFTRNLAFATAAGEFVALLDSDDRWTPDHLQVSVDALESTGKDLVYSTVMFIADQTDMPLGTWGPCEGDLKDFPQSIFGRNFITPSSTVMRRQVLADVGPWNTKLIYCEDYEYWLRCIEAEKQFHWIGGCHCFYRKNHAGATTQKLCGTLEEVADVSVRFLNLPGMREKTSRRSASKAYAHAAEFHRRSNPAIDPSADFAHAATLLMKAWRLRPSHIDYPFMAAKVRIASWLRRTPRALVAPPSVLSAALDPAPVMTANASTSAKIAA